MTHKRPRFAVPWHAPSDQPDQLRDPGLRRALRIAAAGEYLRTGLAAAAAAPLVALRCATLRPGGLRPAAADPRRFLGVAVSPLPGRGAALHELVDELGARLLEVRVPVWERDRLDELAAFMASFRGREVHAVVCQDRASVCDLAGWERDVARICAALPPNATSIQIGNAVNRRKWGCAHLGEYRELLRVAAPVVRAHPRLALLGSSVIDFEPLATWRSLAGAPRLDGCAALLYVDRRGPPAARQYALFDAAAKMRTVAGLVACSPRCADRLWITEVNWPLAGTGEHAPTSNRERVDEAAAARHLEDYCRTARATGLVERVYVWQLVARGYGLVDDAGGALRRRPAFDAVRRLLSEGRPDVADGGFGLHNGPAGDPARRTQSSRNGGDR